LFQPQGTGGIKQRSPLKEVAKDLSNAFSARKPLGLVILGLKQPQAGIHERLRRSALAYSKTSAKSAD